MNWYWCFWHQNNVVLEDIKPHSPNPSSPNHNCRLLSGPPLTRSDRLPSPTISLCKISLHQLLQDHCRLNRLFLVAPLQAEKPPPTIRTLTINPLQSAVTSPFPVVNPPCCKTIPSQPCLHSTPDTEDLIWNYRPRVNFFLLEVESSTTKGKNELNGPRKVIVYKIFAKHLIVHNSNFFHNTHYYIN